MFKSYKKGRIDEAIDTYRYLLTATKTQALAHLRRMHREKKFRKAITKLEDKK